MVWAEMMSMSTSSEYKRVGDYQCDNYDSVCTEDVDNNVTKSTKRVKEYFDVDFTCCTSCCSYDDYDW